MPLQTKEFCTPVDEEGDFIAVWDRADQDQYGIFAGNGYNPEP